MIMGFVITSVQYTTLHIKIYTCNGFKLNDHTTAMGLHVAPFYLLNTLRSVECVCVYVNSIACAQLACLMV